MTGRPESDFPIADNPRKDLQIPIVVSCEIHRRARAAEGMGCGQCEWQAGRTRHGP